MTSLNDLAVNRLCRGQGQYGRTVLPLIFSIHQTADGVSAPREFHPCEVLSQPSPLPTTVLSRSDCGWTGVSLCLSPVIAVSGAARYLQPTVDRSLPSSLFGRSWRSRYCGLLLIATAIGMYLVNGYSVVKERRLFSAQSRKQAENLPLHLFPHLILILQPPIPEIF